MNNGTNSRQTLDKSILVELLKQKSQEGHDLFSVYLKAFVIYMAITGALLKFALDKNATLELKQALSMMGILISFVGIFAVVFGERIRGSIVAEINNLNEKLGLPLISCELIYLKYTEIVSAIFVALVIIGWIYVIIR